MRRKRTSKPRLNQNGTIIEYSAIGTTLTTDTTGVGLTQRNYTPGSAGFLTQTIGPDIVARYSTGRFMPGTHIRWEPSVSFTSPGRVFVGFTDNPEVIVAIASLSGTNYGNKVKGLGDVRSFPVWQETDIAFPTQCRRKRFDSNSDPNYAADVLDRCTQMYMFAWVEGAPNSTSLGSFWYHDKVSVEGIHSYDV